MNTDNGRKMRASILAQAGTIERIDAKTYKVKSQSGNGWYQVSKVNGEWKCECPDFVNRGVVCKHCFAVHYSITLRDRALSQNFSQPLRLPDPQSLSCKKCGSLEIVRDGVRKNKAGQVQRFTCKECGYRFVVNEGFLKMKNDGKIVCLALDLYFKGNSFKKIADTLEQFFSVNVEHSTIIRWLQKYVQIAKEFVDRLRPPSLSGIYHVDEMMAHVRKDEMEKGHYAWLWNMSDHDTRFLLASRVSQRREIQDARAVFQDGKKLMEKRAIAVVHDGLQSYNEAFDKEFFTLKGPRTMNIRSVGQRDEGLNQSIERIHNTIREREKVMRGMDSDRTAQILTDGIRINYNFIQPHMGLDGKTPAQVAGLDLQLGGIRWKELIKRAISRPAPPDEPKGSSP